MSADPQRVGVGCPRAGSVGLFADTPVRWVGDSGSRVFRPDMLMIGATGRNTGAGLKSPTSFPQFGWMAPGG